MRASNLLAGRAPALTPPHRPPLAGDTQSLLAAAYCHLSPDPLGAADVRQRFWNGVPHRGEDAKASARPEPLPSRNWIPRAAQSQAAGKVSLLLHRIHGHDRAPMRPGLVVVRHYRLFMLTPIDEVPLGARRLAIASCRCSAPTGEAPTLLCFSRVFEKLIGENC